MSPLSPVPSFCPSWSPRTSPLTALAVAGVGPVALALARRVLEADDAALARWSGVAGPGVLVLLGDTESLPWVDGLVYLGRDTAAPSLLLPCTLAPDVAPALLERALVARASGSTPLAVLPGSAHLVPVGAARPVSRDTVRAWLAKQESP
ncbi:bpX5 domain-containing protein [Archangium lansingense]|uniref:MoxR-vWA-beta-propeller ternary system domain-containing protein n=1 Tax=Archangium lansingense TaxID=2995310 RepID=A0ABT4ALM0_9BACT|nr:hypothetical protein [Archangium lansinium]MCY1082603.1 hypothetical protein [Archangium lansinium]